MPAAAWPARLGLFRPVQRSVMGVDSRNTRRDRAELEAPAKPQSGADDLRADSSALRRTFPGWSKARLAQPGLKRFGQECIKPLAGLYERREA